MGDNEFRSVKDIKKEEKARLYQEKIDAKKRKEEAKIERKAEKDRIRNSFGRKVRNFFLTIIFTIALVIGAFFGARYYLNKRVDEINSKKADEYFDNASEYLKDKEYDKALDELEKIDSDYENYSEVKDMMSEAKLGAFDEKVDKLADKKDYLGILELLNESLDDKDLKKTVKKYQDKYLELFIKDIRDIMKDDLESARDKVKKALNIMDSNGDLKDLMEEIDKLDTNMIVDTKNKVESDITDAKKKAAEEAVKAEKKAEEEAKKSLEDVLNSIQINEDEIINSLEKGKNI
ncbi:MAG: hypothetical protein IKF52_02175 [Clostridia bacterium]|nr:hypothetical protein [Clostridia bacterium]